MSRLRAGIILVLVVAQALALMAGTLMYYRPVRDDLGAVQALDRTWLAGLLIGLLAALMTAMLIRMVRHGCQISYEEMKSELSDEINTQARQLMATRDAVIFGLRASANRAIPAPATT